MAICLKSSRMRLPLQVRVNLSAVRGHLELESNAQAFRHADDWLRGAEPSRNRFGYLTALFGVPGSDDPSTEDVPFLFAMKSCDLPDRLIREVAPHASLLPQTFRHERNSEIPEFGTMVDLTNEDHS